MAGDDDLEVALPPAVLLFKQDHVDDIACFDLKVNVPVPGCGGKSAIEEGAGFGLADGVDDQDPGGEAGLLGVFAVEGDREVDFVVAFGHEVADGEVLALGLGEEPVLLDDEPLATAPFVLVDAIGVMEGKVIVVPVVVGGIAIDPGIVAIGGEVIEVVADFDAGHGLWAGTRDIGGILDTGDEDLEFAMVIARTFAEEDDIDLVAAFDLKLHGGVPIGATLSFGDEGGGPCPAVFAD